MYNRNVTIKRGADMAKDKGRAAELTMELPGMGGGKKRGRPVTGNAKSAAERMAAMRERRLAQWPEWLRTVYQIGYRDAIEGRMAPYETWDDREKAQAYVLGTLEGNQLVIESTKKGARR